MKNIRNLFTGAALALLSGCGAAPNYSSTYSEGPNYNGQRTPINAQPVNCTIVTRREGSVYGGQAVYNTGRASETCVSTPRDSYGRNSGIYEARQTIGEVTNLLSSARRLEQMFQGF